MDRYFEDESELKVVKFEFVAFSGGRFPSPDEGDIHGGARILENATLTLDELELEAMVIGNANTNATTRESEVRSEAILMMKKLVFDCLVDCLIDYLLFSFNFELVKIGRAHV